MTTELATLFALERDPVALRKYAGELRDALLAMPISEAVTVYPHRLASVVQLVGKWGGSGGEDGDGFDEDEDEADDAEVELVEADDDTGEADDDTGEADDAEDEADDAEDEPTGYVDERGQALLFVEPAAERQQRLRWMGR